MVFNPKTKKGDRISIRANKDGERVRFFKSNDEVVDV
jgi:large subunit ribosomal protein L24